ncbi:PXA domain protein [Talaromyces stipitatus ATCC 10500]|uniref:PXA domain protein n=1 Tax=Talaromyces stipitatus (strain ATCC 10500 / CBS 375.48 / QM 6759 / NRRL 1006) TaxID=441959 RepID=B8M5X5_TALSN|nr:PXA domain protein [Talaromyces stipitatus ATCC 10500]EED20102.1 PXA domain protein [Talaromyces stipitatus ATCC 10500]
MTTSLPRRGPSPFNTAATTSQSRPSNGPYTSQQPGRTKSRTEHRRNTPDAELTDTSGDKNTVTLIRRVLCPDASAYGSSAPRPLQDLLPPLTSSNDVDLQLYALIAVIIKEFVYSWYARITPDHVFVDEVLQLIAHCTRALEQRLRRVDVAQLVLDEVTGLIQAHLTAYRIAAQGSDLISLKSSTPEIYHNLHAHPALSPVPDVSAASRISEQQENENVYRHLLAQGVLAVLLPTEDLENVCLRTLVEDVLSDLILGNQVNGRVCEGWFIWTAISKVITVVKQRNSDSTMTVGQRLDVVADANRLERFGLLSDDGDRDENARESKQSTVSQWLWKILYSVYLAYFTMRFIIGGLLHTALSNPEAATAEILQADPVTTIKTANQPSLCRPVLRYRAFSFISQLMGVPQKMPWLTGSASLVQSLILAGPGKLGETGSVLDR